MDDKGFIFTLDAVLALIPVFIIIMALSSSNDGNLILPSQQLRLSHQAQDVMDAMSQYRVSESTLLGEISQALVDNDKDAARDLSQAFLDENLPGANYKLVEINQLNGAAIISNGNMESAQNVAVGTKNYGNHSFRLYVWT
ncbi:MAG TPA: hypothetical protein VMC48_01260 [Methanobacterium sp.]|nr:hypothetical protein [Methanobacterium sp.]